MSYYQTEDQLDDLRSVIAARDAEISDLRTAMQRQANAVKMLDMSRVARAETMMQHAQVLHDQSNHSALESERSANALLTTDIARKDAEIARLREALSATFDALDRSSSPFPLSLEMTLAVLDHAKAALANGGGE